MDGNETDDVGARTRRWLWENVLELMEARYGRANLTRLARETGLGQGSTTRIKDQQTSVGIDVLEKIGSAFGVMPWQLLAPRMGGDLYRLDEDRRLVPVMGIDIRFDKHGRIVGGSRRRDAG